MKSLISVVILVFSFSAFSQDKASLLAAWEHIQKNHSEVKSFEKISDNHYKIKFVNMPFEGELVILAYGIEDLDYYSTNSNAYTKSGYFEVELVGATEDMLKKYRMTYSKWSDDSNLYFNSENREWETRKIFTKNQMKKFKESNVKSVLSKYKNYLLFAFLLYFLFIHIKHNKRMKETMDRQNEAIKLHYETNKLLKDLLIEMKRHKD